MLPLICAAAYMMPRRYAMPLMLMLLRVPYAMLRY